MSTDRDTTRIVLSWLRADEHVSADRLLDDLLNAVDTTPQRRSSWLARRFSLMNNNNIVRYGVAAAAVVLMAVVGIYLIGGPNTGEPPVNTPAPGETPAPSATTRPRGTGSLDPGTYAIGPYFPVQLEFTIADSWEVWGTNERVVRIWKPCQPAPTCTGYSDILTFEIVTNVMADPCQATAGPSLGTGVDDLVNALTNLPGFEAGPVTDVSVDGQAGKSFALAFISEADETCAGTGTWQWTSDGGVEWGPDTVQRVIVLEADGTRIVLDAVRYGSDGQEMDAIIDSIRFL